MLPRSSQGIFVLQQLLSVIRTSCCLLWKQLFVSILGHAFAWTVTPFHPWDDDVRSVRSPFQQPRWHSLGRKVCGRNAHCCTLAFILVASQRTCNFHHHRLGTPLRSLNTHPYPSIHPSIHPPTCLCLLITIIIQSYSIVCIHCRWLVLYMIE